VNSLGLPTDGAAVQQHPCNSSMNQKWRLSGAIRLDIAPSLCLRRGGDGNGFQLFLGQCSGDESSWDYYF
jgi:hypothetical protein